MKCRVLQLQTHVYADKERNRQQCMALLERELSERQGDKEKRIDLVCLPEMFTTPYETSLFPSYAEPEGGESWQFCSKLAKKYGIYFSAGTMPEVDTAGRVYNTAYVFDREGRQIAKHRKVHLFDINIKGGQYFKESDTLTAGDQITVFDTEFGKMGICICYDLRFPEMCLEMAMQGAKTILVPASFNMTTGPVHWELLYRQRAIDNQCYMIGTSTARDDQFTYHSYGHSLTVSPWGDVMGQLKYTDDLIVTELDYDYLEGIREQLPLLKARRN